MNGKMPRRCQRYFCGNCQKSFSQTPKFTYAQSLISELVKQYYEAKPSYRDLSRKYDIDKKRINGWVQEYSTNFKNTIEVAQELNPEWTGYLIIRFIILVSLLVVQLILSSFLLLIMFFRLIGQNGQTILITLAVIIGGLTGTLCASYLIGIFSGLLVFASILISKKVTTINTGYFFEGKRGWAGRFTEFS